MVCQEFRGLFPGPNITMRLLLIFSFLVKKAHIHYGDGKDVIIDPLHGIYEMSSTKTRATACLSWLESVGTGPKSCGTSQVQAPSYPLIFISTTLLVLKEFAFLF